MKEAEGEGSEIGESNLPFCMSLKLSQTLKFLLSESVTSITHRVFPLWDMVSKLANTRIRFTGNYLNLFPGLLSSCLISTLLCLFAFIHLFTYSAFIERLHNHSKYSPYAQIAHSGGDR